MIRRPPRATRSYTLTPSTSLFRSPQCQYSTKRQGPAPVARRQPDIDYTVQALARTEGSRFDQKRDRSALADDRTAGRVERGCSGHGIDGCFRNVGLAGYPVESSLGSASFAVSLSLGHERRAQAGRWRNTRCRLRGIAACPSPFHPRASAEGGVRAGSKRDTGNPQCRSMGRCVHGMRVRFNEVRRVGPAPDDGMARPLWRPLRLVLCCFNHAQACTEAGRLVVNQTRASRNAAVGGEAATACAPDSPKFGALVRNLMTAGRARYGDWCVMFYGHLGKRATCVYVQLKLGASSACAAMVDG